MTEPESRREAILKKLNQGSIILSVVAGLILLIDKLHYKEAYQGLPPISILGLVLIFLLVARLNRRHHSRLAGIIFIATYFVFGNQI